MQTPLERAKSRTLKEITGILRLAHSRAGQDPGSLGFGWRMNRISKEYSKEDLSREEEVKELFAWGVQNPQELEVYMAGRSPGTISRWAVSWNRRLCAEAEKIVKGKAADRSTLLDYCSHFGVLLEDVSKVTLKAAFGQGSKREQTYIRKIEYTKKKIKEFVGQMVANGDLDPAITVKELMEALS